MTMPELIPLLGFDGVRDPDLVAMIEKAQGTFTYKATLGFAQAAQKKRDAEREAERQRLAEEEEAQRTGRNFPGMHGAAIRSERSSKTNPPAQKTSSISTQCWHCADCPTANPRPPRTSSGSTAAIRWQLTLVGSPIQSRARWRCRACHMVPRRGSSSCISVPRL